ncbi:MAG: hypothetical protein JEZ04_02045 [Spirochaetales bacterium]|nr:hypothetical protein [Spirochaetales bacterium]
MKMKLIAVLIVLLSVFSLSMCVTVDPEPEPAALKSVAEPEVSVEIESEPAVEAIVEEEFIPSKELYTETFSNIKFIIANLNGVISSKDYETWLEYLTDDYIEYYSNPDRLSEYTEQYKQRGYKYSIENLRDYFLYLVVISRANAVVDEIVFIDKFHIKALTEIKGKLSVLYYLEKIENSWKIGIKPEN